MSRPATPPPRRRPSGSTRRGGRRRPAASTSFRLRALLLVMALLFTLVTLRALQVQVVSARSMAAEAAEKMTVARDVPARRGAILGRDGQVMAATEDTVDVTADPWMISTNGKEPETMGAADKAKGERAPAEMAAIIARHLHLDPAEVEAKLRTTTATNKDGQTTRVRWVQLARQVPSSTWVALIAELNEVHRDAKGKVVSGGYLGVFREPSPRRVYPMGKVAANVLGSMSQGKGLMGLEYSQESQLAGTPGRETFETSPMGKIPLGNQVLTPATDGRDIQLTIDPDLQWMVEQRLAQRVDEVSGNWGVAIVMDVETGELLTMANYPSFDPNDFGGAKAADLGNRAITATYEPGSVQKVLTLAALLDAGVTTPDATYRIGPTIEVGEHEVKDAFSHGDIDITTRGILVNSSNVGAVTAARQMDPNRLRQYMQSFGLGQPTTLGLPGEATGSVPPENMPRYQADSMAFGYGISMTAVQMAAAVAGVADGGVYTAPSIIKAAGPHGTPLTPVAPPTSRRVISEKASRDLVEMMEQRTIHDFDKVGVPGYRTGAKTGSARLASTGYSGQVASMIGIGPIEDPQVLVYVLIARPDTQGAGLGMAGPVYRDIMTLALPRYGVTASNEVPMTQLPLEKK